jgi:ankyrin repeat protein
VKEVPVSALPPSPDLSFEKKQAKALVRDCRAGKSDALDRVRKQLPRLSPDAAREIALADAQFVIARERGFDTWTALKAHIESALPIEEQAEKFLEAIRDSKPAVATRILDARPAIDRFSIFTATAAGNADAVAKFISQDPSLVHAKHSKFEVTPLVYACGSPFHKASADRAAALRRIATMLMDAGASPNSFSLFFGDDDKGAPISALYYACIGDHVAMVELLLSRGANTQDGESIYHAAQDNRVACLERLVAHGADLSAAQSPYGNTPLYFLAGHNDDQNGEAEWLKGFTWLLEHGADPNVPSGDARETPLHGLAASNQKLAAVRQVLAHGADVNLPRADGRTPYRIAYRHNNTGILALLREHGANTDGLTPMERFIGACVAGDAERARALLAEHPDLIGSLTAEDRTAMADAIRQDNADAIRLMVDLGFPLDAEEGFGGIPLHDASWLGKPPLVRLLLDLGSPVNVRDRQFGCSPLAWAAHGSRFCKADDASYLAIVDMLIDAGSQVEYTINKWGEPMDASPAVKKHLKTRGFLK